jgi:phage terminase large subunit
MRYDHLIGRGFNRWTQGEYTPGQIEAFHDFKSAFILLSGSYRSGKSEILSRAIIRHAYYFPNSKAGVFRAHLASLKKSTLPTVLELIHPSWVYSWSNTDLIMLLKNGSTISFIGADFSDRLGSIELTIAGIDEAAELTQESVGMIQGRLSGKLSLPPNFDELQPSVQQYLESTLDIRQTWMACNPKSTNHILYKNFFDDIKPGHKVYTSNSVSNRNLPKSYLVNNLAAYVRSGVSYDWVKEQVDRIRNGLENSDGLHLKEHLTPFGQRNLLGLWVAMEGAIYDLDESIHLVDEIPDTFMKTNNYVCGVDFGFHNPRIIVLEEFEVKLGENLYPAYVAVDYWYGKNKTSDDLIDALKKFREVYNWSYTYFPHDQPGILKTARKTFGNGKVKKAKTSVKAGINVVTRFLSSGRLLFQKNKSKIDKCDYALCWDEMSGYSWRQNKDKEWLDEPVKKDDHFPDSVRYALYTRHFKDEANILKGEYEESLPGYNQYLTETKDLGRVGYMSNPYA